MTRRQKFIELVTSTQTSKSQFNNRSSKNSIKYQSFGFRPNPEDECHRNQYLEN
ncbi:hypothetical protein HC931_25510 [Candidatus Gracilibacteria bacterium]|nr:hypothetical protein [Candidatus Gracilibacteria bacterium]NJM90436.1 hypothetical protein [Hydrococcus sp. RU_2_2]NJQ97662.1 hypothetical protein [Hydrococcus sp. CSU_1_8]